MFNLKKVFAILSFEESIVKLVILENNKGKTNCIFFKQVVVEYDNTFTDIEQCEKLNKILVNLTIEADKFIGINVKKYIINVSDVDVRIDTNISPVFKILNNIVMYDSKKNYLNKIQLIDSIEDKQVIYSYVSKWNVDGVPFNEYPENEVGNNINFEYLTYSCEKKVYANIHKILSDASIIPLSFVNNQVLANVYRHENKNAAFIDIKNSYTKINVGNKVSIIPFGYETIETEVKTKLGLEGSIKISQFMKVLNIKGEENIPVIEYYDKCYLSCKEVTSNVFAKILNNAVKKFANETYKKIDVTSIDNIIINGNDKVFEMLKVCEKLNFGEIPVEYVTNDVMFLTDRNVGLLIDAFKFVKNQQKEYSDHVEYSIDAYVDNALINNQLKQNILVKIGIISTQWAAKIGD